MTEYRLPTEQELDMLLEQAPVFDLNAVKQKTFSVIEMKEEKTIKCKLPLRRIFVAAVVCALSVSMMAAAEYVSGGSISRVLGIQKAPVEAVAEEKEPPEEVLPEEPAEGRTMASCIFMGILFGAVHGIVWMTNGSLAVNRAAPHRRGAANGTFYLAFDAAIGIAATVWGVCIDNVGYANTFRLAACGYGVMIVIGLFVYLRRGTQSE